jgi:serine/threonine protein kinase
MSINHFNDNVCTKTGVHLGNFKLANADGELIRDFETMDMGGLEQAFVDDGYTLEQRKFTVDDYLNNDGLNDNAVKLIGDRLGSGSFGTAFRCIFMGKEYVIKIPNSLWRECILMTDDKDLLRLFLGRRVNGSYALQPRYDTLKLDAIPEFEEECKFNEMAVDPFTHRQLRGHVPGSPLPRLSRQQYLDIMRELNIMKAHEGYEHIHKIVGFVPELPVIFSEPCVGSLESLIKLPGTTDIFAVEDGKLSIHWLELAKQIGDAVDYLNIHGSIAHVDIKPDNILYNEIIKPDGSLAYHWKLSDFGLCVVKTDLDGYLTKFAGGTALYLPIEVRLNKNNENWEYDAYECSLYSYMLTILQSIKFNLPGGYLRQRYHLYANNLPNDADLYDYACIDPEISILLYEAKYRPNPANNLSRDNVFKCLSEMFCSEGLDRADIFIQFMMTLRRELAGRNAQAIRGQRRDLQRRPRGCMGKRRRIGIGPLI